MTGKRWRGSGFTLIEMLIVMAIIGILASLIAPRYIAQVEHAKEAVLKQQLTGMRDAIDRFYGQHDRYPNDLQEIVDANLLRAIPVDPITESATTWKPLEDPRHGPGVFDVHSGAKDSGSDGRPYATW